MLLQKHPKAKKEEEEPIIIRAKWMIDDAKTLEEAMEMASGYLEYLKDLQKQGYELEGPIEDDYGFLCKKKKPAQTKKK